MRYWETRKKYICFNEYENLFKQRDINPLLCMQVNEYGNNGIKKPHKINMYENITKMEYNQVVDHINYTNIYQETQIKHSQTYKYKRIFTDDEVV